MNGVLTLRRVGLRAQVRQRSFVAEGAEAVADTLRDVHSTAVHLIEAYPLPLPEGRRAGTEVHDDIEHGAADAGHVLRLAGCTSAKWMPRTTPRADTDMLA